MKIEQISVENLKEYENNPRKNENAVQAVADSIKAYGFNAPIVVDKNMVIIAGHTRLKAAKLLGLKEVPVVIADTLTEQQANALRLADNKTAELSSWDYAKAEQELGLMAEDESARSLFEETKEPKEHKAGEIDLDEISGEEHRYKCNECGFEFD